MRSQLCHPVSIEHIPTGFSKRTNLSVVLYENDHKYGVAIINKNGTAYSPNYAANDNSTLRSFVGSVAEIIDWVSFKDAKQRFDKVVLLHLNRATERKREKTTTYLQLVHG